MTLKQLFNNCAYLIKYDEVGNGVNYAFREDGDKLYIYFQGSRGDIDWTRNFSFWKKPYKDMEQSYWVHAGFLAAWKEVEDIVIARITEKLDNGEFRWKKLRCIGYSHGGALAAFAHECCWFHRPDAREELWGVGFEAPRIAALGVDQIRNRWAQFVVVKNQNDIVTHMPPALFGYRHVGTVMEIGGRFKLWETIKGLFKKETRKKSFLKLIGVRAHYAGEVMESLRALTIDFDI